MVDFAGGWETVPLTKMLEEVNKSHAQGKYCIINDRQGNVATFFRYKGYHFEFAPEVIKTVMGKQSVEDAVEKLRVAWVHCARVGENMCIDCGRGSADFKTKWTNASFPTATYFDFAEGRKHETLMKIIKTDEDFDWTKKEKFSLKNEFMVSFMTTAEDQADVDKFVESLPGSDKMRKLKIV